MEVGDYTDFHLFYLKEDRASMTSVKMCLATTHQMTNPISMSGTKITAQGTALANPAVLTIAPRSSTGKAYSEILIIIAE